MHFCRLHLCGFWGPINQRVEKENAGRVVFTRGSSLSPVGFIFYFSSASPSQACLSFPVNGLLRFASQITMRSRAYVAKTSAFGHETKRRPIYSGVTQFAKRSILKATESYKSFQDVKVQMLRCRLIYSEGSLPVCACASLCRWTAWEDAGLEYRNIADITQRSKQMHPHACFTYQRDGVGGCWHDLCHQ